jgi:hypothetical protein
VQDPKIENVLLEVTDRWLALDGVNGVAQGKIGDKDCIEVLVSAKTPEIEQVIPGEFRGFPVRVREIGDITAQE